MGLSILKICCCHLFSVSSFPCKWKYRGGGELLNYLEQRFSPYTWTENLHYLAELLYKTSCSTALSLNKERVCTKLFDIYFVELYSLAVHAIEMLLCSKKTDCLGWKPQPWSREAHGFLTMIMMNIITIQYMGQLFLVFKTEQNKTKQSRFGKENRTLEKKIIVK